MELADIIDNIHRLPASSKAKLMEAISLVEYPKGYQLYRENARESKSYFLRQGLARAYSLIDGRETTFWFGVEGDFITPIEAMNSNGVEYAFCELMEDSQLYELDMGTLTELYATDIEIANWGIHHMRKELIRAEKRYIARQFKTSLERYREFVGLYPEIMRRVNLRMVASYLGISIANLSRIRGQIR